MSHSIMPALRTVFSWTPVKWLLSAAVTVGLPYAGWWLRSRASFEDVAVVQVQVADEVELKTTPRDSQGEIITLRTRVESLESRLMKCEVRATAIEQWVTRMRIDQVRFQAASAQPRAALRAQTADDAQRAYLEAAKIAEPLDTEEAKAYRRALETRPPR